MKAGWLRHTISIQAPTITRDAGGGASSKGWATITNGQRKAAITPVSSATNFVDDQQQEVVTHKIQMRYLAGVTTAMQVLFGARVFEIRSVITPREIRRDMILLCWERQAR